MSDKKLEEIEAIAAAIVKDKRKYIFGDLDGIGEAAIEALSKALDAKDEARILASCYYISTNKEDFLFMDFTGKRRAVINRLGSALRRSFSLSPGEEDPES
jgi:hypothetical protein